MVPKSLNVAARPNLHFDMTDINFRQQLTKFESPYLPEEIE